MVVEKCDLDKDAVASDPTTSYWEERYTISQKNVVRFLEAHKEKVLITGKYLNVVRECGKYFRAPHSDQTMSLALTESAFTDVIEKAYKFASSTVLDLIMHEVSRACVHMNGLLADSNA